MTLLGTVKEWDSAEEDWTHYIERVKFFFVANDVSTEGKKRAIPLSVVGAKHYAVLRELAENKPENKHAVSGHVVVVYLSFSLI